MGILPSIELISSMLIKFAFGTTNFGFSLMFQQGRLFSSWESNEVVRRKLQEIKLPTVKYLRAPIERTDMKAYVKLLLPPNLDTSGKTKYPLLVHV